MKTAPINNTTVLKRPRITEKAALKADSMNVYTFEVNKDATKKQVIASIKDAYKVTPKSVRLLAIPRKEVFRRGKSGVTGGGKKAYVYLKKGDKIEVM
ncbi:MAG: ribosomal protein L23 [Parcubacteria bacterium C7867-005]|nr:MAG: ribosomal protein L23 [Parcubacteria bacterium C7867-005]